MAWRQQVCSHQSIKHHQTRPESVICSLSFRNIQQHQEPSASISNIQQPNWWHTLTFDTPWHTMAYLQVFHVVSHRFTPEVKAKTIQLQGQEFSQLPWDKFAGRRCYKQWKKHAMYKHPHKHAQICTNMNKPRDHLCGHSLAESLKYGVCQLWWFLQVQGFRSKMPPKGKNEMGNWSATNPLCALHISSIEMKLSVSRDRAWLAGVMIRAKSGIPFRSF